MAQLESNTTTQGEPTSSVISPDNHRRRRHRMRRSDAQPTPQQDDSKSAVDVGGDMNSIDDLASKLRLIKGNLTAAAGELQETSDNMVGLIDALHRALSLDFPEGIKLDNIWYALQSLSVGPAQGSPFSELCINIYI